MTAPTYVTAFVLVADVTVIVALLAGLALALAKAGWEQARLSRTVLRTAVVLSGWFAIALLLSYLDAFRGVATRIPTIQFGILIPIAIGLFFLGRSRTVLRILDAIPQHWIVGVQFYRALGVIFIILLSTGYLPAQFAVPAGWGDISVGLLAPVVGLAYARGAGDSVVRSWNIFGLLDLVVAVGTGFLTSPSPFQLWSLEAPNELISAFPLVMVPVFAVPLSVLLHAASLMKLSRESHEPGHKHALTA
jgi:hypothetical protein